MNWLLLAAAAFSAGVVNALAGGGSFLTFPSLVYAGVPPVAANASSTVALVPGAFSSGLAYRRDIAAIRQSGLPGWFAVCFAGGLIGAGLLLVTSDHTFRRLAPWLLLFATLLFAFGRRVSDSLGDRLHGNRTAMLIVLFPIAVYGGYFGGGIGIMMLAAFRLYGLSDIHAMNGIKTLLSATLNTIAAAVFIAAHQIWWPQALVMMAAGVAGGFAGPMLARRLRPPVVRGIVIGVGVLMTGYFFWITAHSR